MVLPTGFCPMMWSTLTRSRIGMAKMRSRQHWMAMTPRRRYQPRSGVVVMRSRQRH